MYIPNAHIVCTYRCTYSMYIPNVHIAGEELPPQWNNKCESINHWAIRGKEKFLFMWPVLRSLPDRQPKPFFANHSDSPNVKFTVDHIVCSEYVHMICSISTSILICTYHMFCVEYAIVVKITALRDILQDEDEEREELTRNYFDGPRAQTWIVSNMNMCHGHIKCSYRMFI